MFQVAWAQQNRGMQVMKDIARVDTLSKEFNSKPKDGKRVDSLISSYEQLMGRSLTGDEKKFLSLEFATLDILPRFDVKGNMIHIYDGESGSKDLVLSIEIIDAEKNIFKYGNRTFKIDPNKSLHENIQFVLKELQEGDKVSFWQKINPFAIQQAQAAWPAWVKYVLIGAVALIAGIFIGKALQKNKANKEAQVAEGRGQTSNNSEEEPTSDSHDVVENTTEAPAVSTPVTTGEEPSVVMLPWNSLPSPFC
jgi:hypothetical protein